MGVRRWRHRFLEARGGRDRSGLLILEQAHTERFLLAAVREAGLCEVCLDTEAVGLAQDRDGASSFVRDALGLPLEGLTTAFRLIPGLWRLIRLERGEPGQGEEVSHEEVADCTAKVLSEGPLEVVWASRFRIHRRSAPRFRVGRVSRAKA